MSGIKYLGENANRKEQEQTQIITGLPKANIEILQQKIYLRPSNFCRYGIRLLSLQLINLLGEGLRVYACTALSIRVGREWLASVKRWLERHHVQCNQARSGLENRK